jgi:hypothetical protein
MMHQEHFVRVQRTESMRMQLVNGDRSLGEGARKVRAAGTRRGPAQRAVPHLAAQRAGQPYQCSGSRGGRNDREDLRCVFVQFPD